MRTGSSRIWDEDADGMDNIIYLSDHRNTKGSNGLRDYRRALRRRQADRSDTLWNLVFIAACLSVLIILFLH
jgi:hypothetical protein